MMILKRIHSLSTAFSFGLCIRMLNFKFILLKIIHMRLSYHSISYIIFFMLISATITSYGVYFITALQEREN